MRLSSKDAGNVKKGNTNLLSFGYCHKNALFNVTCGSLNSR